jgi:hypothetical protein
MLTGETLNHTFSVYPNTVNPLSLEAYINGTALQTATSYFIQLTPDRKAFNVAPNSILNFGKHLLTLRVTDGINYLDNIVTINVRNRAPYFSLNINATNTTNYTTFMYTPTSFRLPTIISPDSPITWVRLVSNQAFIYFFGTAPNITMFLFSTDFY